MLKFVKSQKETRKLNVQNFLFIKYEDCASGKEIWRCENRTCKLECIYSK